MASFKAPSGAQVEITLSDYGTSYDLFKSVLCAIRKGGVGSKIGDIQATDIEAFQQMDLKGLGGLADMVIDVLNSKEVEGLVFKCMERCSYDGERINRDTFEPEARRGDFLFVAFEVMKVNVLPFLSHLSSGLKGVFQVKSDSPQ